MTTAHKEEAVLGWTLAESPRELPPAVDRLIENAPDSFEDLRLGAIAVAIRETYRGGEPVGVLTVSARLGKRIEDLGGDAFLASLANQTVPRDIAEFEAEGVWRIFQIRRTRTVLVDGMATLDSHPESAATIGRAVSATLDSLCADDGELNPLPWADLNKPVSYDDNLLGDRFLERQQGMILYGPAGCGKSVAGLQACTEWSAGLDGLHIKPARPLRIVILQTEDSVNDIREALAGIRGAPHLSAAHQALIERNLIIFPPVPGGRPEALAALIRSSVRKYSPDLVNVNPLLAFCPGDPARELGGILYQFVDPVIKAGRVGFLGVHHTPKMNNRDTSDYGRHDHQYLAAGDARVANWPRAMIIIEEVHFPVYRFRLAKRGHRAGWTANAQPISELYFKHHFPEIRWEDAAPEDVSSARAVENYRSLAQVLPPPDSEPISRDRVRDEARRQLGVGKNKADSWLKLMLEDGLAERVDAASQTKRKEALFRLSKAA